MVLGTQASEVLASAQSQLDAIRTKLQNIETPAQSISPSSDASHYAALAEAWKEINANMGAVQNELETTLRNIRITQQLVRRWIQLNEHAMQVSQNGKVALQSSFNGHSASKNM